jgi:hypothetical protein
MKKILIPFVTLFSINAFAAVVSQGNSAQAYNIAETFTSLSDWWWILVFCPIGDFFKPCPSRAKAGFKKSPSG